jgi:alpha-D-xyloside xylohydrolase
MPSFDQPLANGRLRIDVISPSIFRVRYTLDEKFGEKPSFMVLTQPDAEVEVSQLEDAQCIFIRTSQLTLQIDKLTGAFTWRDSKAEILVREPAQGGKHLERVNVERRIFDESIRVHAEATADGIKARVENAKVVIDRQAFQTKLEFLFSDGEAIYGLGQHEDGILNYRGKCQYLYQQNMKVAMPVIVSSRGWAILFDTSSYAEFHDDEHGSYFWTEVDDEMDFYFIVGPEFDQIISHLRKLTGKPTMLPRWAYGYVQSKERYRTQQELIDTAREFRERSIPLDCIVQDWLTWTGKFWGDKHPDPERYPDPSALTNALHAIDVKLMVSIWPIMRGESPNQIEMRNAHFLLGNDATYDAFNLQARDLYWQQANRGWFRHGIDAWWCDCTEPFEADWKGSIKPQPWKRVQINTNESKTYLDPEIINAYSMLHSQGIYEHQRATTSEKRVVNLTRSGFPGQQRYGAITWSGDTCARWEVYRRQIADGLNFCVTGNPRWTIDIGGFFVGRREQWFWRGDYPKGCEDEGYRELYVRWLQLGTFLPMFRSHGTDTPREPWRFGKPGELAYDSIIKFIQLRYQLLPYIYSTAAAEWLRDDTMMRMLAFDFRTDPNVLNIRDQFMFGRSIMVCPVTHPMYFGPNSTPLTDIPRTRDVYLPAGTDWYDFWTGSRHTGGQTITASATLDALPIFVRAGAILPVHAIVQHASQPMKEIELRIYPGSNGSYELYDDTGDGYGYEAGEYAITPLSWNDASQRLHVKTRLGNYTSVARDFVVKLANHPERPMRLRYNGTPCDLSL